MNATDAASSSVRSVGPGVWGVNGEARIAGGLRMPLRMTVLELGDGTLALHSPVAFDEQTASQIAQLGRVAHIIAPSAFHHLHVDACRRLFPEARLSAPPALRKKRPDLRVDDELVAAGAFHAGPALQVLPLQGAPGLGEVVFFHSPSGSLLVTDLLFNVVRPQGLMTNLVLTFTGTRGKLAQSRLWNGFAKDKRALTESVRQMLRWPFERLVPCHGDVIATGAHAAVEQALRWR